MVTFYLDDFQSYLAEAYAGDRDDQGFFVKFVEEVGEVAEQLNQKAGRKQLDEGNLKEELGAELADVVHYVVAIAVANDISLSQAILEKDLAAAKKYRHNRNLTTFLAEKKEGE